MKTLTTLILLSFNLSVYSQNTIEKQIEWYNESIHDMLKTEFKNKLGKYNLDTFSTRIIPSFYYNFDKDSIEKYEINTSRWELIGISRSSKDTIWFQTGKTGISEGTWFETPYEFRIINKSKYCFYIYCIKNEPAFSKIMGFMNNGKVEIVDYNSNYYKNMNGAIKYFWGSIEKVKDIEDVEKFKEDLSKGITFEQAKDIIRNSYTDCYRLYPKDTLFVLDTYLNEIEVKIHLFDGQKDFLKRLIQKNIKIKDRDTIKNPEYDYFMDNFISYELLTTLTHDQYYDSKKNNFYFNQKVKLSRNFLRNYYINQQKNPPEQFDEFLRKEVFKK